MESCCAKSGQWESMTKSCWASYPLCWKQRSLVSVFLKKGHRRVESFPRCYPTLFWMNWTGGLPVNGLECLQDMNTAEKFMKTAPKTNRKSIGSSEKPIWKSAISLDMLMISKSFAESTAMRWSCLKRQEHGWKSVWGWTSARKSPRLWIWNMRIPIFWDSESRFIKAREINMWSYHILHPKHWTG